jgi:hypothetical protein
MTSSLSPAGPRRVTLTCTRSTTTAALLSPPARQHVPSPLTPTRHRSSSRARAQPVVYAATQNTMRRSHRTSGRRRRRLILPSRWPGGVAGCRRHRPSRTYARNRTAGLILALHDHVDRTIAKHSLVWTLDWLVPATCSKIPSTTTIEDRELSSLRTAPMIGICFLGKSNGRLTERAAPRRARRVASPSPPVPDWERDADGSGGGGGGRSYLHKQGEHLV